MDTVIFRLAYSKSTGNNMKLRTALPSVLTNSLRQLDIATVLIADIVEQILMETCILDVIGRHLAEKAESVHLVLYASSNES